MTRIDELPADRRAVLQLLLKQGKSYDDLSSLLRIEPAKVRERARDALDRLGPADGSGLALERQDELSDYLLGQQDTAAADRTRELLEESGAARAWARVVSDELKSLAPAGLPAIPADRSDRPAPPRPRQAGRPRPRPEDAPARPARGRARTAAAAEAETEAEPATHDLPPRRSSRTGGFLLLAAVGAAVAILIVFVVSGSSDDGNSKSPVPDNQKTQTGSTTPRVLGQINLNPPRGTSSKALAALTLVQQGNETDILFQGQGIPPNQTGDVYALWVSGNGRVARLGFMPRVGKSGKVRFPGALPSTIDLSKYTTLLMTRETNASPTRPGPVLLSGTLPAGT
jgi:hypothetical protein